MDMIALSLQSSIIEVSDALSAKADRVELDNRLHDKVRVTCMIGCVANSIMLSINQGREEIYVAYYSAIAEADSRGSSVEGR